MNITKQSKEDFWKTHIASAAKVPAGARAYCRIHDLDHLQFYYWRTKLRKKIVMSTHPILTEPFLPVSIESSRIRDEGEESLPDAEWVGRFAVEIIRGLSR